MPESRLWQNIGIASFVAGAALWAVPAFMSGLRPDNNLMLSINLAAAFICIAGAAGWTAGRVMQALQLGSAAAESARLRLFGLVQIVAGIIPVIFAAVRSRVTVIPTANQIWLGTAGAALVLLGINDLLAHRILEKAAGTKTSVSAD